MTKKAETPPAEPEPAASPEPMLPDGVTVQTVGDPSTPSGMWRLVTNKTWQISVAPDGLLMLPRHLHPRECDDFIGAITAAAKVAAEVIAANALRGAGDDRSLPPAQAIVRGGPDRRAQMSGMVPMLTTPGPNQPPRQPRGQAGQATIGRPRRNGRRAAPPGAMI